ncbi:hypothetical protein L1987_80513 [Smallanthus sonchifolius]|uniref:Uncharacterized protein n=1 Tax=Smallanthus sonchifolius TaxID=185202 RepID=A0ACB8YNA1_9ASTR|nr:hypothetical protein L1987_80513 [Smallanthus sonchifolius]
MADSTSRSLLSLSRFLSLETETGAAAEDDEMKEHWTSLIEDEEYLRLLLDKDTPGNYIESRLDDWIKIGRSEAIRISVPEKRDSESGASGVEHIRLEDAFNHSVSLHPLLHYMFLQRIITAETIHISDFTNRMCCNKWQVSESSFLLLWIEVQFDNLMFLIVDMDIIGRRSSTIAMAATLMAIDQDLSRESMEMKVKSNWVNQLFDHVSRSKFSYFNIIRWDHI